MKIFYFVLLMISISSCNLIKNRTQHFTRDLEVERISQNLYLHRSKIQLDNGQTFPCNGLIYFQNGKVMIFDTPPTVKATKDLIRYCENKLKSEISGIVVNHFHVDCLGGLSEFHQRNILSYSSFLTQTLASFDTITKSEIPKNGFDTLQIIPFGNSEIINRHLGEAHTKDNIVSFLPDENVLFGGCMIKEVGAGKGNLADATLKEWSNTVEKVKQEYPNVKIVIPGHGKIGGVELFDYTIELFKEYR